MSDKVRKTRSEKRNFAFRAPYLAKHPLKPEAAAKPAREPRWYEADDAPRALPRHKISHSTKLRSSITPGTILILLAGKFRGKRVVFLKQLPSGLLLVTGPYKINGVPLRRVNQAYVIATSTKINVNVNLENISDDFFKRAVQEKSKKDSAEFFKEEKKTKEVSEVRKAEQKRVDAILLPIVQKTEHLHHYLNAKFSLTDSLLAHDIKF